MKALHHLGTQAVLFLFLALVNIQKTPLMIFPSQCHISIFHQMPGHLLGHSLGYESQDAHLELALKLIQAVLQGLSFGSPSVTVLSESLQILHHPTSLSGLPSSLMVSNDLKESQSNKRYS